MSGMYIRGKVPDSCRTCPIVNKTKSGLRCPVASRRKGFSCAVSFGVVGRPSHCPIVPVPDHGRLIDADALKERATKHLYASNHGSMAEAYFSALIDLIDSAPTIIPADKEAEA